MELGNLRISWAKLAVAVRERQTPNVWLERFALRCHLCKRLTLGCSKHKFCGLCERCRVSVGEP